MSAVDFFPPRHTLGACRAAAQGCRGCDLWKTGTHTVFGEGPTGARVVLIGEQPGREEDLAARPFVGPAGRVLDQALEATGISRAETYVTNVVKHLKWEPAGRRRMLKKPNAREIKACLPWLEKEIELIRPEVLVLLGATAAQAIIGREFDVSVQRGVVLYTRYGPRAVATVHPSSVLRQLTSEDRAAQMARFTEDLRVVAGLLRSRRTA
jgi:uracil-DNA glycosylase